jgi:hypothetical protein
MSARLDRRYAGKNPTVLHLATLDPNELNAVQRIPVRRLLCIVDSGRHLYGLVYSDTRVNGWFPPGWSSISGFAT